MIGNRKPAADFPYRWQAQQQADTGGLRDEIAGLSVEEMRRLCYDLHVSELAMSMEIETLHRAERERDSALRRYMHLYDFCPIGYVSLDLSGTIRSANLTAASVLGVKQEKMSDTPMTQFIVSDHRDRFERNRRAMIETREPRSFSLELVKSDETQFPARLEWILVEALEEKASEIRLSLTDISDQKKIEAELEASREQLRQLSRHLQSLRERERYTVSRAIHDELSQVLAVLKMDLSSLESHFTPGDTGAAEKLNGIRTLVDRTIKVTKYLVNDLRPYLLDELGLKSAVRWAAREFGNRSGIEIETIIEPSEFSLDEARAIAIYRILQELLTNVEQHSNATTVVVCLKRNGNDLVLDVSDNGRGISGMPSPGPSFGLMGVQERAYEFGGEMEIGDISPTGTRVRVRIPLETPDSDPQK